jgi:hypothetical protein
MLDEQILLFHGANPKAAAECKQTFCDMLHACLHKQPSMTECEIDYLLILYFGEARKQI